MPVMDIMTTITEPLRERLMGLDRKAWPLIARECGVSEQLPAKVAYQRERQWKPKTLQPLINFFADVDAGRRAIPTQQEPSDLPGAASSVDQAESATQSADDRNPDRVVALAFGDRREANRGRAARAE